MSPRLDEIAVSIGLVAALLVDPDRELGFRNAVDNLLRRLRVELAFQREELFAELLDLSIARSVLVTATILFRYHNCILHTG